VAAERPAPDAEVHQQQRDTECDAVQQEETEMAVVAAETLRCGDRSRGLQTFSDRHDAATALNSQQVFALPRFLNQNAALPKPGGVPA
jgi:hypothetical protein